MSNVEEVARNKSWSSRSRVFAGGGVALLVGVFVGIFMDHHAMRVTPPQLKPGRTINYVVQPYEKSNLVVAPGDTINWSRADGQNQNLQIYFPSGDTPCTPPSTGGLSCVIDGTKAGGDYFYQCLQNDGSTFDCPDPGIQQRSTGGNIPPTPIRYWQLPGYFTQVAIDFRDLANWTVPGTAPSMPGGPGVATPPGSNLREVRPKTGTKPKITVASFTVFAAVACNAGTVEVTEENPTIQPKADLPISVPPTQTMWWDGPHDFQISFNNGKSPCSNLLPTKPQPGPLSCVPNTTGTFNYTVTATGCATPLLNAELDIGGN